MKLKDFLGKKIVVHFGSGKFRDAVVTDAINTSLRPTGRKQFVVEFLDKKGLTTGGNYDINVCFYNNKPVRDYLRGEISPADKKNISLSEALTYLKEKNS